jgi:hypothetical protein
VKCEGSDCTRSPIEHPPDEMRFCGICSKPICAWCLTHCNPSHRCQTLEDTRKDIEHYRKEFAK